MRARVYALEYEDRLDKEALIRQDEAFRAALRRAHPEMFIKPAPRLPIEHYEAKVIELRRDAAAMHAMYEYGESSKLYDLAKRYAATARRLRWQQGSNRDRSVA